MYNKNETILKIYVVTNYVLPRLNVGSYVYYIGKLLLRQMLQQAKDDGLTINVRHTKILFCGAARAGKTSFSRLLRNKEHDTDYKSTPAGNAQQVLITSDKVNVLGTNWINLDGKLETQQITNRLIVKLQTQKHYKSQVHHNASGKFKISTSVKKNLIKNVHTHQKLLVCLLLN